MQTTTTRSNRKYDSREHADSFAQFLFWTAWLLYIASLFLPAARFEFETRDQRGWELLHVVTFGIFLSPYALLYLYVNFVFWISPWRWRVRRSRDAVSAFYLFNLLIATAVAWHALRMIDDVYIGYFVWATAFTLLAIAFCFPRTSHLKPPREPVSR